ncbi:MAG: TolC family protein, partial [Bacteroidota bacterium]
MKQIILIIVLSINISHSQSLDHLIEIAINQNLHLKALEKEYLAALERAPQVSQLPQPELGVGGFPLPVQTRLGPQITRLSATQMLPWWGTLESKEILILKQAQAQYERIAAAALKVKYEVEQAYFMLYELGQSQIIMQRNIEVLERLEQVVLAKVESGRNSTADVLRIQLQIEELTQEVQILERQKRKPQIAINQLLNRDLAMVVVVTDSLQFVDIKLDREQIKQQITNDHPMLKRYALQAEAA